LTAGNQTKEENACHQANRSPKQRLQTDVYHTEIKSNLADNNPLLG